MFKIYVSKAKTQPLDIENNYLRAKEEVEKAVATGANLVVFPQGFLSGVQLGMLENRFYFRDLYNEYALKLSKEFPDVFILGDYYLCSTHTAKWENRLYIKGEILNDTFEIEGIKFTSFNNARQLRDHAKNIDADCIIFNSSEPVVAGSRHLLKKMLTAVSMGTGRTVIACLGGHGFTSHPYVYMPAIGCIKPDSEYFTTDFNGFLQADNLFAIEKKTKPGSGMLYNLPGLDFDVVFNQNPLVPKQIDEKEYCLDLFSLQSYSLACRLSNINRKTAVVALSGGLDSALALLVTVNAFDILNKDRGGIRVISMPGFGTSNTTKGLAGQLAESLGLDLKMIDITSASRQALLDIGHDGVIPDVTFENVQARMRTLNGLNLANRVGGIMIGTGDLSEEALGFSTYGGDHLASYNVNSCVSKTVIRTMLPYVMELDNLKSAAKPIFDILNIPVSPELVPHGGEILQKTEEILAPYKLIDFFIYCFVVAKMSPIEMAQRASCVFEGQFGRSYLREKAEMFCRRFITGQFKRSAAPEGAIVTHCHLIGSERGVPSDSSMGVFRHYLGK